jgi:DNA-binding transcriptional ArsR family regulator
MEGASSQAREDPPVPIILHLGADGDEEFVADANVIATGRTCVIGASGSGKSYAVGVICEELCKNHVPFAIVDTEGEHAGLKEKYEVIVIGDDERCDLQWASLERARLASQAPDIAPLLLDVSETDSPRERVGALLSSIYLEVEERRTPYLIIVEEADRFIPQNGERVQIFDEVARRGRKRGVGLMVCTQRPSLVDKNVLSQCGNQLIGKLVIKNDLQAVAQFFAAGRELPKQLTSLEPGRFFAMGGLSPVPREITIRKMDTHYSGTTPKLGDRVVKPFATAATTVAGPRAAPSSSSPSHRPAVLTALPRARPSERGTLMPNGSYAAPLFSSSSLGSGAAVNPPRQGINPTFRSEDVPTIVKRDRSFIFFGREEVVASAALIFRPLLEVGVAVRTGVIKKRIEMRYLILDGETGKFVDLLGDAPVTYEGLERLVGLDAAHIEVLQTTRPDREMSALEIASRIGVSKESLRRPLKFLEERRLIRSSQVGRTRVFRRIFDFPDFLWHESEQPLEQLQDAPQAAIEEYRLDEEKIREVIKGLVPQSDVQSFERFLYPFFRVELIMDRKKKRVVWLDGRTGKEVRP